MTVLDPAPPAGDAAAPPGPAPVAHRPAARVLPTMVVCFVVLASTLMLANRHLFRVAIAEDGDFAANALLVREAKQLRLLHGNYSRLGFSHPGPALLYVQASGEVVFRDGLGVVPAPYNAHALAVIILNSALLAVALALLHAHLRSRSLTALMLAVIGASLVWHGAVLTSTWMPRVYVVPFLLLLVATASVVAGRTRDLWAVALAGGLLLNAHVEFFLFVPLLAIPAAAAALRARPGRLRDRMAADGRHWAAAGAVLAVLAAPIVLSTLLEWPGQFDDYLRYSSGNGALHSTGEALGYTAAFWWDSGNGLLSVPVAVALAGAATALARAHPEPHVRHLLGRLLATGALATAGFVFYAVRGIDVLTDRYVGYFYWAVPALVLAVLAVGAHGRWVAGRAGAPVVAAAAAAVLGAAVLAGPGITGSYYGNRSLPAVVRSLDGLERSGRPVVLGFDDDAWPDAVAVVLQARRAGLRVCADDPTWALIMTERSVCSPAESALGRTAVLRVAPRPEERARAVGRLAYSTVVRTKMMR